MRNVQDNAAHTCSYSCDRPECIKAQRDELADAAAQEAVAWQWRNLRAETGWKDCTRAVYDVFRQNGLHYEVRKLYATPVTAAPADLISGVLSDLAAVAGSWIVEAAGPSADARNDCAAKMLEAIEQQSIKYGLFDASTPAAPGIDRADLIEIIEWWNAYTGPVSDAIGEIVRRIRALADASPKGALVSVSPNNCRNRLMAEGKPYPKSDGPFNQQANSHGAGVSE